MMTLDEDEFLNGFTLKLSALVLGKWYLAKTLNSIFIFKVVYFEIKETDEKLKILNASKIIIIISA